MDLQPSYYSIIPASVRYDKDLKPNEKLMYGEITALAQAQGYCWASNNYFAELYGVSKETVSRWISKLDKKGYIRTKVFYVENSKQIDKRYIYISDTPIDKIINTPPQKNQEGIDEKIKSPIDKNVKENNTSINNTSINTSTSTTEINESNENNDLIKINKFYQENIGMLAPNTQDHLRDSYELFGYDMVIHALTLTVDKQATYGYAKKIMERWLKNNIKTMEDVKAEEVARQNRQSNSFGKSKYIEVLPDWVPKEDDAINPKPIVIDKEVIPDDAIDREAELQAKLDKLMGDV